MGTRIGARRGFAQVARSPLATDLLQPLLIACRGYHLLAALQSRYPALEIVELRL